MTQGTKSEYWQALKAAGYLFDRKYVQYTTDELAEIARDFIGPEEVFEPREFAVPDEAAWTEVPPLINEREPSSAIPDLPEPGLPRWVTAPPSIPGLKPTFNLAAIPLSDEKLVTVPGETRVTHLEGEPIRRDSKGRVWLQDEFMKPDTAKPRGRRKKSYTDTGTIKKSFRGADGYTEEIEFPGSKSTVSEALVTLPSYQVGTYYHPNYEFKIHTYGGKEGFDRLDILRFYGGQEQVPSTCKPMYISTVRCYDMASVVRAIREEFREIQLDATRGVLR